VGEPTLNYETCAELLGELGSVLMFVCIFTRDPEPSGLISYAFLQATLSLQDFFTGDPEPSELISYAFLQGTLSLRGRQGRPGAIS